MFVAETELEAGSLRQGDIVKEIQLLGAINPAGIQFTQSQEGKRVSWTVPAEPSIGNAMVLSHCCEIAPENGVKLTSIVLAPLRDISTATEAARREELIRTNIIDVNTTTASFLKYFYLPPNEKLHFPGGAVVDFSKCFSIRNKYYEALKNKKVLQLTDDMRMKMSFKLATYFFRNQPRIEGMPEARPVAATRTT